MPVRSPWDPSGESAVPADQEVRSERSGTVDGPSTSAVDWLDAALAPVGADRTAAPLPPPPSAPEQPWDLIGSTSPVPETRAAQPQQSSEDWVYVDPNSYSNPYSEQPIYSSGPPGQPTAVPPLPVAAPVLAQPQLPPGGGFPDPVASGADTGSQTMSDPNDRPEPGDLKIKERRSWKTWQLLTVAVIAAVFGMWVNGNAGNASGTSAGGSGGSGYKLPPPSGSAAAGSATSTTAAGSTHTTAAAGSPAAGSTPTTAAVGSTATTVAGATGGSSTTTPAAVGPATVLVPETQQTGNWTSPAFTIAGGTWNIGWAFQCAPAPSAPPSFQIFVVDNGAAPGSTPAVTSSAASGQAVTPLTSTGSQQIIVQTSAACRWVTKVTGSSS